REDVVQTPWRHRQSRCELLSPSEAHWSTTKSAGMWKKGLDLSQAASYATHRQGHGHHSGTIETVVAHAVPVAKAPLHRLALMGRSGALSSISRSGRVPGACGYSFETSPKPPASSNSAGHEPSQSVFNPSLAPFGLSLNTLSPLHNPMLNPYPVLHCLH